MFTGEKTVRPWLIYSAAALVFSADRWLKGIAWGYGAPAGKPVEFALFLNKGIAFSLPLPPFLFWPLAVAAAAAVCWLGFGPDSRRSRLAKPLAAMILLGGLSNIIDRRVFGATVDYIIFFGVSAVNLADLMIIGGLAGLVLLMRRRPTQPPKETPPA
jgi:lipoprotein signal peptidase